MIKNLVISGFAMNLLFKVSPYTFTVKEGIIATVAGMAIMTAMLCSLDKTILDHVKYRNRSKFRRLVGITTLK